MTHQIFIANRRRQPKSLQEEFGDIPVFDVTFAGGDPLLSTLSPMYPHGDLPVPYSERTFRANFNGKFLGGYLARFKGFRARRSSPRCSSLKQVRR